MQSFHTGSMAQGSVGEGMGLVRWPEGLLVGGLAWGDVPGAVGRELGLG